MTENNQPNMENIRQVNEKIASGGIVRGFFVTVKTGQTLVATNIFTGNIIAKSNGLKVVWPWLKNARLSSNHSQSLFRPSTSTLTADNISINYDADYAFKIVDQRLFEERSAATRESTAMNEELIKTIGRILDQVVKDYLRQMESDVFYKTTSLSLENLLQETPTNSGLTVEAYLRDNFGIEITKMFIKDISLPKSITDAAENARAASARREMEIKDAEAKAIVTTTQAEAEATKTKLLAGAEAEQIQRILNTGLSEQAVATKLANEALTNGANPNTIIFAATQGQSGVNNNLPYDMATMLTLFKKMMEQNNVSIPQDAQPANLNVPAQQETQQSLGSSEINWSNCNDDEYLTEEDSLALSQERNQSIVKNGRYHISLLTPMERERYSVASQKGHRR